MLGLKKDERKLQTTEMRMLSICGKTLRDGITNETTCKMTGVEKIEEFMKEKRLWWFSHTERKGDERVPVKAKKNYS